MTAAGQPTDSATNAHSVAPRMAPTRGMRSSRPTATASGSAKGTWRIVIAMKAPVLASTLTSRLPRT